MPSEVYSIIETLESQEVRELVWAIGSSPMLSSYSKVGVSELLDEEWCLQQVRQDLDWLRALDASPAPLLAHLNSGHHLPLGKRFERLLSFWFKHSKHWDLIWEGKQFVDDKTTIGEIDFLVRELQSDELMHIEVACKFYLSSENSSNWASWLGPNAKDCFADKMIKFERQLALSQHPLLRQELKAAGLENVEPKLFLKGFFFHHFSLLMKAKAPRLANTHYNAAWFCFAKEFDLLAHESALWYVLEKKHWLSIVHPEEIRTEVLNSQETKSLVESHFEQSERALLLVQVLENDGRWNEISRGFVVADAWPSKKQNSR